MAILNPTFAAQFLPDMDSEREARAARERVFREIGQLQLESHVGQLESVGYTILNADRVGPLTFVADLRSAVIAAAERRSGIAVDVERGASHASLRSAFGQVQFEAALLEEAPIFEQALMNPAPLALITYLLGESCTLSHLSSLIKGPGSQYLPLHADQNQSSGPPPFPFYAQVANATWALTDYTVAGGALCFVPGSHKLCRAPTQREATDIDAFVPVEMPAGSVVVWHGNTWHGALPRTQPGVRISLVMYFNRWYHTPFDGLSARITPDMLSRNPPRFARLTGVEKHWLTAPESPRAKAVRTSLFA